MDSENTVPAEEAVVAEALVDPEAAPEAPVEAVSETTPEAEPVEPDTI